MNKLIIRIFTISFCYFSIYAGIGAQFNIDNDVKVLTAGQKIEDDSRAISLPLSSSPKNILRKNSKYKSPQEDGFFIQLLKCLKS